jgi:hypothetical protein
MAYGRPCTQIFAHPNDGQKFGLATMGFIPDRILAFRSYLIFRTAHPVKYPFNMDYSIARVPVETAECRF